MYTPFRMYATLPFWKCSVSLDPGHVLKSFLTTITAGMRGIVGSWSPFALLGGIPIEGVDPVESLWIIDSSTCCLQEGKMVL